MSVRIEVWERDHLGFRLKVCIVLPEQATRCRWFRAVRNSRTTEALRSSLEAAQVVLRRRGGNEKEAIVADLEKVIKALGHNPKHPLPLGMEIRFGHVVVL